ncbi:MULTISPECIES: hypothetical protein [Aerococcus]|uniref:hypothetical protein n=1 Tax=Aerococcus TaxID=1375 RepID=UPI000DCCF4CD|nr:MULTISPECIES: hypothetical protein [Aerococcus]KAA9231693.1 hypothetical protein F6I37_08750 [Aerococcus mictus]MDK6290899.1 hypothetical protein [Aerococcus urinae]MDK6374732.1 hypothetical protein [Aerococcus urinae]MDK6420243.1 hypothetical protein [Aerococcus urinae]MDK8074607.1 hypothetical protein [Aerococcus urinae]
MSNNIVDFPDKDEFQARKLPENDKIDLKEDEGMDKFDILFKELKDDMREREERSERRYQEQKELLANSVEKQLDSHFNSIDDQFNSINDQFNSLEKSVANNREEVIKTKYSVWLVIVGTIGTIIVAVINQLPNIIDAFTK